MWSLFITLAIYSLYGAIIGVSTIDDLGTYVSQPIHLGELLAIAVGGTAVIAAVVKVTFRKNVQMGDCWDIFRLKPLWEGAWLIVYTVDGLEYKGALHSVGWGRSRRELVLREPKLIVRDKKNWKILDEMAEESGARYPKGCVPDRLGIGRGCVTEQFRSCPRVFWCERSV